MIIINLLKKYHSLSFVKGKNLDGPIGSLIGRMFKGKRADNCKFVAANMETSLFNKTYTNSESLSNGKRIDIYAAAQDIIGIHKDYGITSPLRSDEYLFLIKSILKR